MADPVVVTGMFRPGTTLLARMSDEDRNRLHRSMHLLGEVRRAGTYQETACSLGDSFLMAGDGELCGRPPERDLATDKHEP